jgi:hypothetical protein
MVHVIADQPEGADSRPNRIAASRAKGLHLLAGRADVFNQSWHLPTTNPASMDTHSSVGGERTG